MWFQSYGLEQQGRRHNSIKTADGVMVLKGFQSYRQDAVCILKFSKGHNSVNSVDGVMALVLFRLSDGVLYLYQVLSKYLIGFQSYGLEQ